MNSTSKPAATVPSSVIVAGVTYVREIPSDSPIKIVVLQRGWVAVGRYERDGDDCKLTQASVIRIWGTTKGLGQLADGPTDKTVLDKAGTITFNALTAVLLIDAEESAWAPVL